MERCLHAPRPVSARASLRLVGGPGPGRGARGLCGVGGPLRHRRMGRSPRQARAAVRPRAGGGATPGRAGPVRPRPGPRGVRRLPRRPRLPAGAVRERFEHPVAAEVDRLLDGLRPAGRAELRREFAGPLAAATVTRALGLADEQVEAVLGWYDAIVAAVNEITAGRGLPAEGTA